MRHRLEYWALSAVFGIVDRVPSRAALAFARGVARLWWGFDLRRRRVARDNVLASGITTDPREARRIGRASAQHFGMLVVESLKSAEILEGSGGAGLEVEIEPDVRAVLEDPERPLILASGHFGSWEVAAQYLSRYKPVAGITRPMNNPLVEALVARRKPRYRFEPIPKYAADARRFLAVLEERRILALLVDQHAREGGVRVDFFGRPAATYTTAAMLHLVTGAPLCFAVCRRIAPMRFRLTSSGLIERRRSGDKQADVRAILDALNRHLEAAIRTDPGQYLWGHRRWRDD